VFFTYLFDDKSFVAVGFLLRNTRKNTAAGDYAIIAKEDTK
jgi:hypothetical protein